MFNIYEGLTIFFCPNLYLYWDHINLAWIRFEQILIIICILLIHPLFKQIGIAETKISVSMIFFVTMHSPQKLKSLRFLS